MSYAPPHWYRKAWRTIGECLEVAGAGVSRRCYEERRKRGWGFAQSVETPPSGNRPRPNPDERRAARLCDLSRRVNQLQREIERELEKVKSA